MPVMLEILKTIPQVNPVLLEESMYLRTSVVPKQPPQLRHRKLAFTVGFECNGFQGSALGVMPRSIQKIRQLFGQIEDDLSHEKSIKHCAWDGAGLGVIAVAA